MESPKPVLTSPYVGPRPFERQDSGRFFGRERETNELLSLVIAHRVTVLYAPSGAGKTSLLNASLVPKLEEKGFEVLPSTRVLGPTQSNNLEIENIYAFQALAGLEGEDADPPHLAGLTIAQYLQEQGAFLDKYGLPAPRVLIFDQFEELFTAYPARWEERESFFGQLQEALEAVPLLRIIFSLREDYLAQLEPYAPMMPDNLRHRFRLERMTPEAALTAVRGPLQNTERVFTDAAAEKLVEELRKIRVESQSGTITAVGKFIEPVQLQVVCQNLWLSLPPEITTITERELDAYGDVTKALSQFYVTAVQETIKQPGVSLKEGDLRDWFEKELITPAETRSIVFQDKETGLTGGIPNEAIRHLDRFHIIRGEVRSGSRWYELTHDRFIDPILKANQSWRETLAEKRRKQVLTIIGTLMIIVVCLVSIALAEAYLSNIQAEVAEEEAAQTREFMALEEQVQNATATAQRMAEIAADQTRAAQVAATSTAIARNSEVLASSIGEEEALKDPDLYLVYSGALFPNWTANERIKSLTNLVQFGQEVYIEGARELFLGLTKAEQAEVLELSADEDLGIDRILADAITAEEALDDSDLYLARSETLFPDASTEEQVATLINLVEFEGDTYRVGAQDLFRSLSMAEQEAILDSTVGVDPEKVVELLEGITPIWERLVGHTDTVRAVAFSPDGRWLASGSFDNTVRLWDRNDPTAAPTVLTGHTAVVAALAFSPDGRYLASGSHDGTALLWSMNDLSAAPQIVTGHSDVVSAVSFSPNGRYLATGSYDRTILVRELSNLISGEIISFDGHQDNVLSVAFSPDSQWLASSSDDRTVRLWNLSERSGEPTVLTGHEDVVLSVAFSPDGAWLASGSFDGTVRMWDMNDLNGTPRVLTGQQDRVWTVAFSPDGQWLASGGENNLVHLWNATPNSSPPVILRSPQARVWSLAFSPESDYLASGTGDAIVRLWKMADPLEDLSAQRAINSTICSQPEVAQYIQDRPAAYSPTLLSNLEQDCIFWMSNWPTDFREVNQGFGENPDSYGQFGLPGHEGVDIEAPLGSNVYAVADGEVYQVRTDPSGHNYGIAVYIRHKNGYRTVYAQLQEALVEVGDMVMAGDLIALSNNTGNSFGSHLHFGLYLDGATEAGRTNFPLDIMDPTPFLWHLAPLQFINLDVQETVGGE